MSDTRQTLTTIAAAVYGYYTGDWGTAAQYAALAYGATQPGPHIEGPRLNDLTVAPSQYGVGVPQIWGNDRVACTPIWSLPELTETTESGGGKGSGPTTTTHSYSLSFAVLIGERITGIRRMWLDAKLVYDARPQADTATALESAQFREFWTAYMGTEDQLPDPTIETAVGSGKVPALRGYSYVVFTDLPLEKFGNRMPTVSVEVATGAVETEEDGAAVDGVVPTLREPLWLYPWSATQELTTDPWREQSPGLRPVHSLGSTLYTWISQPTSPTTSTSFDEIARWQAAEFAAFGANTYSWGGEFSFKYAGDGYFWNSLNSEWAVMPGGANLDPDAEWYGYKTAHRVPDRAPLPHQAYNYNVPVSTHTPLRPREGSPATWAEDVMVWRLLHNGGGAPPSPYVSIPYSQNTGTEGYSSTTTWLTYMLGIRGYRVAYHPPKSGRPGNALTAPEGLAVVEGDTGWVVDRLGAMSPNRNWATAGGTAKQLCAIEYRNGKLYQNARGPVLLPADPNYNNSAYWDALAAEYKAIVDPDGTLARQPQTISNAMRPDVAYPVVVTSWAESTSSDATRYTVPAATNADPDEAGHAVLSDIVSDICERAGLTTAQIDVTELTDRVIGFTRANRMPARGAIDALRAAFLFDVVESAGKLKFPKRGRAVSATITADYLGAGVDQPETERVKSERGQESELPDVMAITYRDLDLDYQPGTQEARRRAGESDQQSTTELPVVMRASSALRLANIHLFSAWGSRTRRSFATTLRYAGTEPGDVVSVSDGDSSYTVRILERVDDGAVLRFSGVDEADSSIYTSTATGATPVIPDGATPGATSTVIEVLHLPLLRDTDDQPGVYIAAGSVQPGSWPGCVLYRSEDNGASFEEIGRVGVRATFGTLAHPLHNWAGGNTLDPGGCDVRLGNFGALSNATWPSLLAGANAVVIGDEILQFMNAELIATNTYRISGLLRGRLGTEVVPHSSGERFVVLDGAVKRYDSPLSLLGQEVIYRGTTYGNLTSAGMDVQSTESQQHLVPLSPLTLEVFYVNSATGYVAKWRRKTRTPTRWTATEQPTGETTKRFRVRVWNSSAFYRLDVLTDAEEYTFGAGLDLTYYFVEVAQVSDRVGTGDVATVQIGA